MAAKMVSLLRRKEEKQAWLVAEVINSHHPGSNPAENHTSIWLHRKGIQSKLLQKLQKVPLCSVHILQPLKVTRYRN